VSTESKALRTQNNKFRKNGKGTTYFDKRRNRWVSQVINIYGVREFASFHPDLEDDAHGWRLQKVAERDGFIGSKSDFKRKTVAELLAKWLAYRSSRNRPNTNRFYSITIRTRINPKLGAIKVNRLKPEQIEIAIDELVEQGYAAGSIRGVYATLSKAFKDAVRLGWLPYNPMEKVERIKLEPKVSLPIPKKDTEQLFNAAIADPCDLARLIVGVRPGIRPGEVAGLRWSDFDLPKKELTINRQVQYEKGKGLVYGPPKTIRKKPIPLEDDEVLVIEKYRSQMAFKQVIWASKSIKGKPAWKGDSEIVFPNKYGNLQNLKSDAKWFRRLCSKAGVPNYQLYQMRKRAFTDLMMVTNIATVMAYSGHTQASTLLKHYISPEIEDVRLALEDRRLECKYPMNVNEGDIN
jgi:integrase